MKVEGHYYTYLLECADGHYYVGITNDLDLRLIQHNDGIDPACYTFKRRPVALVYYERYHNVNMAIEREKQLKKWSRAKKAALIAGDVDALRFHAQNTGKKRSSDDCTDPPMLP